MQPPVLEDALLRLSDVALLCLIETFLRSLVGDTWRVDQPGERFGAFDTWCHVLSWRVTLPHQSHRLYRDGAHLYAETAMEPETWLLVAPSPAILRERIQLLSLLQGGQALKEGLTMYQPASSDSYKSEFPPLPLSGAIPPVSERDEIDPDALATYTLTLLPAGKPQVMTKRTALFQALRALAVLSPFEVSTHCHGVLVAHGRYSIRLAEAWRPTTCATYACFRPFGMHFQQVVREPGVLALPGRKIIVIHTGDQAQLAFLQPLAPEEEKA